MSANQGALPGWFRRRSHDDAQSNAAKSAHDGSENATSPAQSTTGGSMEDQAPVVVWEAANRMEAEIVAGRLNSENIPTIISGESLGSIYGLTTGTLAAANVLVPAALAEKALEILESSFEWEEIDSSESSEGDTSISDKPDNSDTKP
jgi:hypothetical protein